MGKRAARSLRTYRSDERCQRCKGEMPVNTPAFFAGRDRDGRELFRHIHECRPEKARAAANAKRKRKRVSRSGPDEGRTVVAPSESRTQGREARRPADTELHRRIREEGAFTPLPPDEVG